MEPVFTLPWPEFYLAERLQVKFPKSRGYSLLIPMSRQEKGYDLALIKCSPRGNRVVTFQIKASRTYIAEPRVVNNRRRFRYTGFFNCFKVPDQADFILICSMFAPDPLRTRPVTARWYRDCTLLFTRDEMKSFFTKCRTRQGKPESMFYFAFDKPEEVYQTRGIQEGTQQDCSHFLLDRRIGEIQNALR